MYICILLLAHSLRVRTIFVAFVKARSSIMPLLDYIISLRWIINNYILKAWILFLVYLEFDITFEMRAAIEETNVRSMVKLRVVGQFMNLKCTYLELHAEWPLGPLRFQQNVTNRQSFSDSWNGSKSLRTQEMMQL